MGPVSGRADTGSSVDTGRLPDNARRIRAELDELRPGTEFVVVTKTRPDVAVQALYDAGFRDFGENRIEPFTERYAALPDARWHFIGRLHRKYVAKVVGKAALIHSVASPGLLEKIDRSAQAAGCVQPVLLQVNVSGEDQKQGFTPETLREFLAGAEWFGAKHEKTTETQRHRERPILFEHISIRGLMTMAPFTDDEWVVRSCFSGLRALRDEMRDGPLYRFVNPDGALFDHLSMGMTNDYRIALEEGATMVRIGSAVFEGI